MDSEETWLPIPGFEDGYRVSNLGRIWSVRQQKIIQSYDGNKFRHQRASLKPATGPHCGLYVHRLVLLAFVGPCPDGMECRHLDGDPTNNRLENLAWGTRGENNLDRVRHGTHQHTRRTHCPKGHPLDGVFRRPDGSVKQRYCRECSRQRQKDKYARNELCKQGHVLDGVAYHPDGTVWQRYCKTCRSERVSRQMVEHHAKNATCKMGHPLDGRTSNGKRRYCTTCKAIEFEAEAAKLRERDEWCREFAAALASSGLNQVQAAALLGTSQACVWRWMNGHAAPSMDKRSRALELLAR